MHYPFASLTELGAGGGDYWLILASAWEIGILSMHVRRELRAAINEIWFVRLNLHWKRRTRWIEIPRKMLQLLVHDRRSHFTGGFRITGLLD